MAGGQSTTDTTDELAEAIVGYLLVSQGRPGEPGESIGAIAQGIGRSRTDATVGARLTEMVQAGYLTREPGARGAKLHALTEAGLEHYNDDSDQK